jgi:uncharacterized cupredoxin-like copper-binding protein
MRVLCGLVGVVAALGAAVAVSAAQTPVPTVKVTATTTAVTASPAPVAPGATRFELSADAELSVFLAAPKPGRTVDEVIAAVRTNPDDSFEVADIVASAALVPGASRAVTVEIKANTSYLLVNDAGKDNPAEWIITPLATGGAPTGATVPQPDAEVLMRDLRFAGNRTLPRDGTVRVRNIGWAPHFTLAAPLKRWARRGATARALLSGRDRALARVLDFRNTVEVSSILTRGASADYELTFGKRGRYVLVCFFEGHNAQGMFRFVRVR